MVSLVPILFYQYNDAQLAVDKAIAMIETSVARFEMAANALLAQYTHDPVVAGHVRNFVDGCRYACTANLNWR